MSAPALSGSEPRFLVIIRYREPTYALRLGEEREYSASFVVPATDEQQARSLAIARFEVFAELSSVGWPREIVTVEVREAD